jgi:uncharacterized protein
VVFALMSVGFLWQASQLHPDASFQKMVPAKHPYIVNYLRYESDLRPLGNTIRIAVEATDGDIYSSQYLDVLKKITDEVFYIPGIDRGNLKSLWTPNTLWFEATEDGLRSGKVVPSSFDGSPANINLVRDNITKAGLTGNLVANDGKSTVIFAPLLENDPETGAKLDYGQFSQQLEDKIRAKFEGQGVKVHIIGFAKMVGDLIHGARAMALFFVITVLLTTALLYGYSRCWRSTAATIGCCLLAVVWHLGVMRTLGYGLDPYSMLVPFLTFAIGVSHAVQNVNTLAQESLAGASKEDASRATFRMLFVPADDRHRCDPRTGHQRQCRCGRDHLHQDVFAADSDVVFRRLPAWLPTGAKAPRQPAPPSRGHCLLCPTQARRHRGWHRRGVGRLGLGAEPKAAHW